jgi:hypothetical protein
MWGFCSAELVESSASRECRAKLKQDTAGTAVEKIKETEKHNGIKTDA